jgi:lysozyme
LIWWSKLNAARQSVFINIAYNMGVDGVMKFKNTLACAEHNDYFGAAAQMLNSKWSRDVNPKNKPDGRNQVLAHIMRTGKYN